MSGLRRNHDESNLARTRFYRQHMTKAERMLWTKLRRDQFGFHFRKQHPLGAYLLDFYCAEAKLCVEVDEDHHEFRVRSDAKRDATLLASGIETVRFAADSLYVDMGHILYRIREKCIERSGRRPADVGGSEGCPTPSPALPLPQGEGVPEPTLEKGAER